MALMITVSSYAAACSSRGERYSERNVLGLHGRGSTGRWCRACRGRLRLAWLSILARTPAPARRAGTGSLGAARSSSATAAAAAGLAIDEVEVLDDDLELAPVLVGLLVLPGVQLEAALDHDRAALGEV